MNAAWMQRGCSVEAAWKPQQVAATYEALHRGTLQ